MMVCLQVCQLESERLDLEDQLQALQEKLDETQNETAPPEELSCTETLKIKDQHIDKLEKDKTTVESEITKLVSLYGY